MVQEAAVGVERRVVEVGERADEAVGRHDAAHEVVRETRIDRRAERLLDELAPDAVVADERPCLVARRQRFRQRGEEPLGEAHRVGVERVPRRSIDLGADAGEGGDGCRIVGLAIDEQPPIGVARVGRVRGEAAAHESHVEAEVVDDALRQQAHEVRVPGEARVDAVERLRRHGCAAEVVVALEEQHAEARAGEVGGRREAVVSAADDHDVVVGLGKSHVPSVGDRHPCVLRYRHRQIAY